MINEEEIINQLDGISTSFDLKIEDREVLSRCKEMARAWNELIYIQSILEFFCKEGLERKIFGFSIWKLVCKHLEYVDPKQRKFVCIEDCRREIEKWIRE